MKKPGHVVAVDVGITNRKITTITPLEAVKWLPNIELSKSTSLEYLQLKQTALQSVARQ